MTEYAWIIGDVSDATISTWSATLGSDGLAPGKGAILAKIANGGGISNGIADATMSLDGYTAFYFVQGANGREPDAAAAATGTDGMALFFDLPPGAYDVVFQGPAGTTCTAGWGWNGSVASSVEAVVAAGVVTFIQADCQ